MVTIARIVAVTIIAGIVAYILIPEYRHAVRFQLARILISPETIGK